MRIVLQSTLILLLSLTLYPGSAQYLHFNKLNHRVYANYKVGDSIAFTLKETGDRFDGTILGFTDSTIVFKYYEFSLDEIGSIYVDEKIASHYMFKYKVHRVLFMAGAGILLLDTFNNWEVSKRAWKTGGTLIGASLVYMLITRRRLPIDERHTLTIIHTPIQSDP